MTDISYYFKICLRIFFLSHSFKIFNAHKSIFPNLVHILPNNQILVHKLTRSAYNYSIVIFTFYRCRCHSF